MLDKLIFGLAVNSFQGVYAAPCCRGAPSWLRSGALAPEAPLNYMLWGAGGHNTYGDGAFSLALAGARYRVPDVLRTIATDRWPGMLSRERQQIAAGECVDTVTHKTPDFMLASAQDYRAGQRGRREHIWQATLGCDALVFANHPACCSDADERAAGLVVRQRAPATCRERNDALIALYDLSGDDRPSGGLPFTHAFFPHYAFDECVIDDGWAFGRKGDGYVALHGGSEMAGMTTGPDAGWELRSPGPHSVWLCQMGRAETDGSFGAFRSAVQGRPLRIEGLAVAWDTIRGERLTFGWRGPLQVDGRSEPITGFKNVECPYGLAEFLLKPWISVMATMCSDCTSGYADGIFAIPQTRFCHPFVALRANFAGVTP